MKHAISLFLSMAALWVLLSGYYTPLLLGFGLVSCVLVYWIAHRMHIVGDETVPVQLATRLPGMIWELARATLVSNVQLALLLLRGGRDIQPTVRTIDLQARRPLTQTAIGNAITLTPGTLTMRLTGGEATIHALTPEMLDGLEDTAMVRVFREADNA